MINNRETNGGYYIVYSYTKGFLTLWHLIFDNDLLLPLLTQLLRKTWMNYVTNMDICLNNFTY